MSKMHMKFCTVFCCHFCLHFLMLLLLLLIANHNNGGGGSQVAASKKVLIVAPNFYASHFAFHKKLAQLLIEQQWVHQVHILIPEWSAMTSRDERLHEGGKLHLHYFAAASTTTDDDDVVTDIDFEEWLSRELEDSEEHLTGSAPETFLELAATQKQLIDRLRQVHFDIGIAEAWDYAAFPLLWLIGVRHTVATLNFPVPSSFYELLDHHYLEAIVRLGTIPEMWTTQCDDHKKERQSVHLHWRNVQLSNKAYDEMDKRFAQIYHEHYHASDHPKSVVRVTPPKFRDLFRQSRHFFVNTQPFLDFPMPRGMPSKVVYIGGITLPSQPAVQLAGKIVSHASSSFASVNASVQLDQTEQQIVELASRRKKGGLVLVSFGSMIKVEKMPENKMNALMQTFGAFSENYEFLWKFEGNQRQSAGNVHLKSWISQIALLANSATKLFISHCGINSIVEAVSFGVPLLCVPFFGDQHYNAEAMAKLGAAVVLNKERMHEPGMIEEKLIEALKISYKANMVLLQTEMALTKPREEFLEKMSNLH